jgi:hypothetical protein
MITIQINRNAFHYTQTIWRESGKVTCPITRNRAMEIADENPNGRFDGSGGFDTAQPHQWQWQVEVTLEAA